MCSTQIVRADSTLTHVTTQVTQLWLDSTLYFSWLTTPTQLKSQFANLTQLWLNLSQIWLTTHHILPNLAKSCWPGEGVRLNVVVGCFFPGNVTDKWQNLNVFSSEKSVTQHWLRQYSVDSSLTQMTIGMIRLWLDSYPWFSRPTQLWLDSLWVRVESNLTHDSWVEHIPASDSKVRIAPVFRGRSCTNSIVFYPFLRTLKGLLPPAYWNVAIVSSSTSLDGGRALVKRRLRTFGAKPDPINNGKWCTL